MDIRRNNLTEAIKQFTQHLCCLQKLFSWGGNEDYEVGAFLILFSIDYLKEILIPENNKLMKYPADLGEFIRCLVCWFYMGCWDIISNRRNWWSSSESTMSKCAPFRNNMYMSRTSFVGILGPLRYTDKRMLNILMVSSKYVKCKNHVTLTWLNGLIHHGLMYWKKVWWSIPTNMCLDSCELGVNLTF